MTTTLPMLGAIAIVVAFIFGIIRAKTLSERLIFLAGLLIIFGFGIYSSIQMKEKLELVNQVNTSTYSEVDDK